jgi:Animal haem peroxidase
MSSLSGDLRCNEQPQLALMHTVWLREHNRLGKMGPVANLIIYLQL